MTPEVAATRPGATLPWRRVGFSDLEISVMGLGCNTLGSWLDAPASRRLVHAALDCGVTWFDTADVYADGESERLLGTALRGRRDRVVIATKFGAPRSPTEVASHGGGSAAHIRRAVEASLRRLETDWIDLYQMHCPDVATPVEETLSALDGLVCAGLVRWIGCSNFAAWQVAHADWTARTQGLAGFVSAQNRYNLLDRSVEVELVPACRQLGLGVLAYFPLESGLLTGKYRRGAPSPPGSRLAVYPPAQRLLNERNLSVVERLEELAAERGIPLLSLALGGLAAQPCVAGVIVGATTAEQVAANGAAMRWTPGSGDLAAIDAVTRDAGA